MPSRLGAEPTGSAAKQVWPNELVINRAERVLKIAFDDGKSFELPAEYLRVQSPSAEVQGHSEAQRQTIGGKRNVAITGAEPVGNYAVRLQFSDGHDTGLFSWSYLHELGRDQNLRWKKYLQELSDKGLGRDP
jgi:DUF971 family protein